MRNTVSRIGVAVDSRAPVATLVEQARAAESAGADRIWIACHLFLREPVVSAYAALAATSHLQVSLMAMSPFTVHPVYLAMTAATLDEAFPGRVELCLAVGAPADLAASGIAAPRPAQAIEEAITVLRSLFAGEMVNHVGEVFKVSGRRLENPTDRVPIHIAASRPRMLGLAGRIADGVLLSAATSPAFVRECLDHVDAGAVERKLPTPCQKSVIVYTHLDERGVQPTAAIRRKLGFVLRGPHHARNVALGGSGLAQAALWDAYRDERWDVVDRMITDDVLRAHAAAGTSADVRERFDAWRAAGLTELAVGGLDSPQELAAALQAVA